MHNATTTPVDDRIVMPDSEEQCKLLYEPGELVSLGEFGREAGYEAPVLMTAEICHHFLRQRHGQTPFEALDRLIEWLSELREAASDRPAFDAFRVAHGEGADAVSLVVRQHLLATRPYTLISLAD